MPNRSYRRLCGRFLRCLPVAACLAGCLLDAGHAAGQDVVRDREVRSRVKELIAGLGAPRYVERQAAQQELRGLGLAAFDQLLAASSDPDPEVAAAAGRLIETMAISWTRPGDTPEARRLLQNYSQRSEEERQNVVEMLADLDGGAGVAALCRVARYDGSELVSRQAAARVIEPGSFSWREIMALAVRQYDVPQPRRRAIAAAELELTQEFGPSQRTAGKWLRLLVRQATEPAAVTDAWREAIAREQRAVDERKVYTDAVVVQTLWWNLFRAQLEHGAAPEELLQTVEQLTSRGEAEPEWVLIRVMEWMVEAGAGDGIDALLASRRKELTTKRGLYVAADIRKQQGKLGEAQRLADEAFAAEPSDDDRRELQEGMFIDGRVTVAGRLQSQGHTAWAIREYRAAAEQSGPLSINAVMARVQLANLLMDLAEYGEGARELTLSTEAIEADVKSRSRYRHYREQWEVLPTLESMASQRDYLLACAAREAGDDAAEAAYLKSAIELDGTNADILIAMYRARGGDTAFREDTLRRIKEFAAKMDAQIEEDPDEYVPYNQWAWLISNTEGDYAKALRYSQRSLELNPGDAGFLDTLARCYYAVGDLEMAIKKQRQAVEQQPHYMVMQRQLEFFEAERAKAEEAAAAADAPADEPAPDGPAPTEPNAAGGAQTETAATDAAAAANADDADVAAGAEAGASDAATQAPGQR
ncbi:MAG: hypothetical protein AAF790_01235 [Planctomycetota bacterium]